MRKTYFWYLSHSYILSLSPDLSHPGFLPPHIPAHIFFLRSTRASARPRMHTHARAVFIAQVLKTRHYLYGMLINWYLNEWFFPFYCQTPVLSFLEYLEPENFPCTISTHTKDRSDLSKFPRQVEGSNWHTENFIVVCTDSFMDTELCGIAVMSVSKCSASIQIVWRRCYLQSGSVYPSRSSLISPCLCQYEWWWICPETTTVDLSASHDSVTQIRLLQWQSLSLLKVESVYIQ